MHEPFDVTTIIFALLAIFVVWKLRSVLGARTGEEKPPAADSFFRRSRGTLRPETTEADNKVVRFPGGAPDPGAVQGTGETGAGDKWKHYAEPGSKVWAGLNELAAAEPSFAVKPFIDGAKTAYEMIVSAYASGDRQVLQNLLSKDVYDSFTAAIEEREKRSERIDTTFVSFDNVTLDDVQIRDRSAQITVRFAAKLITATRDRDGALVHGDPDRVVDMIDIWTFARDIRSNNPNWKLMATESGH